ncbi:hypothetical protein ACFR9U_18230 [Halorientalis brevis]|uniref:STAS domain-containing protein n=1 Tax=Halorientalis brevis TaxID=1126241 RepID=A0ABD6CFF0_9EURY|nr:hypothetical protein [Halorientalis brevis]
MTAGETLATLADDRRDRGIDLRLAGAAADVCRVLLATGLETTVGHIGDEEPIIEVIERWELDEPPP